MKCKARTAASTRASTRTALGARGPSTSGRATSSCASQVRRTDRCWRASLASTAQARSTGPPLPTEAPLSPRSPRQSGRSAQAVEGVWTTFRPKLLARARCPTPTAARHQDCHRVERARHRSARARLRGDGRRALPRRRGSRRGMALARPPPPLAGCPRVGRALRASNGGRADAGGVLEDYAFFARGLVTLFEATNDAALLDHALALVGEADRALPVTRGERVVRRGRGGDAVRAQRLDRRLRRALGIRGDARRPDRARRTHAARGSRPHGRRDAGHAVERAPGERDGVGGLARRRAPPRRPILRFWSSQATTRQRSTGSRACAGRCRRHGQYPRASPARVRTAPSSGSCRRRAGRRRGARRRRGTCAWRGHARLRRATPPRFARSCSTAGRSEPRTR